VSIRDKLIEFHRAMEVPGVGEGPPAMPSPERVRLRLSLIAEEFAEFCEAIGYPIMLPDFDASWNGGFNMPKAADALADLIYVIEGTNLEFGIDGKAVFDVVHAANMAKIGGPIREDGKRLKPEGWMPPDIEGELRRQGWKG
jgi:predicted HAD superfamily Cof-like phosphohydrolase